MMLNLSANISTMFTEWPMVERPAAAAAAGFSAIEVQFPYAVESSLFARAARDAGVAVVLMNIPPGRLEVGEMGLACLPGRQAEFARSVEDAMAYAEDIGCPKLNCLAGNVQLGADPASCWQMLVENLQWAAERCAGRGLELLAEVMNPVDLPAFRLTASSEGDALLAAVGHPNLRLQYDVYHRRAAGEDWLGGLVSRIASIGHIQFSDYPGRHEPGSGEIDIDKLFTTVAALPYNGWTGSEYWPSGATLDSLDWLSRAQALCQR